MESIKTTAMAGKIIFLSFKSRFWTAGIRKKAARIKITSKRGGDALKRVRLRVWEKKAQISKNKLSGISII